MIGKAWIGLLLALFATALPAAVRNKIPEQAEMSMLVTGMVLVEPDGSVSSWDIDQRDKLPDFVVRLIERSASSWKFEPVLVDGQPRKAKARMSLRIVANRQDDGYRIAIRSGHFGKEAMSAEERRQRAGTDAVRSVNMRPPAYPTLAADSGVRGTVYVVLRINREGAVEDAFAEQVNLKTLGTDRQMERMRDMLVKPALVAARRWTFQVPTTGESAGRQYWSVRVPVEYLLGDDGRAHYGQWEAYLPGPRQKAPWSRETIDPNESPDAMIAGRVYEDGEGMKLLTPLEQG